MNNCKSIIYCINNNIVVGATKTIQKYFSYVLNLFVFDLALSLSLSIIHSHTSIDYVCVFVLSSFVFKNKAQFKFLNKKQNEGE